MADNDRETLAEVILQALADHLGYEPYEFSDGISAVSIDTNHLDLLDIADAVLSRWRLVPVHESEVKDQVFGFWHKGIYQPVMAGTIVLANNDGSVTFIYPEPKEN